jgi:hypothetical protein
MQRHLASRYKPLTTDHVQWRYRQVAMSRITLLRGWRVSNKNLSRPLMPRVHTLSRTCNPVSLIPQRYSASPSLPNTNRLTRPHTHGKTVRHVSWPPPAPTCTQEEGAPPFLGVIPEKLPSKSSSQISIVIPLPAKAKSQQHSVRAGGRWARPLSGPVPACVSFCTPHTHTHTWPKVASIATW